MPYTSYLLKKFDHTHENSFFRDLSTNLEESYNDQPGLHVLMGNLSCNGNQLDALFITRGQVTLLDFKDYEGQLRFSENSPWQLTTNEGRTLFVMGGAAGRNPYHQLFAYKNGLAEFLYEKQGAILEKNHLNINWRHIGGLVLFQRSIDFDNEKLPVKISRWFKVHTKEDIINGINARYSKSLELSDQEIAAILKAFDVKEIHLTKNHRFIEKREKQGQNRSVDGSKLLFIRKMLKAPVPTTDFEKALFYYKTLIKAERSKSTTVSDAVKIPVNAVGGIEQISIPLNTSSPFYNIYLKDGAKQFPKDVFVGLDVVFNKESHTLFHSVIPRSELQDKTSIALNVNEMELSSSALEDLGLGEDLIAEIQARMDAKTKLLDRMEVLQGLLGVAVSTGSDFVLGLSNEEKYTVQLEAELDKIQNTAVAANGLFENFLLNREVSKQNSALSIAPFVQVSPLNPSQKEAVQRSFKQPITVITGPPGTGKTQVVLNIIANAIVHGHRTAFVSRNHKAVDNVLDRFEQMVEQPYAIKFGSAKDLENKSVPKIKTILQSSFDLPEDSEKLKDNAMARLRATQIKIAEVKEKLVAIPYLKKEIEDFTNLRLTITGEKERFLEGLSEESRYLFVDNNEQINIDLNKVAGEINNIKARSFGIQKLLFSWFYKKAFIKNINRLHGDQSERLKAFMDAHWPYIQIDRPVLESSKEYLEKLHSLKKEQLFISDSLRDYSTKINDTAKKINDRKKELQNIEHHVEDYKSEMKALHASLPEVGINLLNKTIEYRVKGMDTTAVQEFVDWLPAHKAHQVANREKFQKSTDGFLEGFKAIALTSLSVKSCLPLQKGIIDLLVVDEASQCDGASILSLLFRAKRIVVIGDPMQLTHITGIRTYEEEYLAESLHITGLQLDYVRKSLFDQCLDLCNKSHISGTFLQEHYRCHPEIVGFSNKYVYGLKNGQQMIVKTSAANCTTRPNGFFWQQVAGEMSTTKNENYEEVHAVLNLIKELRIQNPTATIGVITPFNDQKRKIQRAAARLLKNDLKLKIDSVHKFQGDEVDIVIFSLVVTYNSPASKARFINQNPFLLNVGITRARSCLYIVGDHPYCKSLSSARGSTPLHNLAVYAERLKKVIV